MKFDVFCGPSYRSQAITADAERCMNWYPEIMESPGAKSKVTLYPTPGINPVVTLPDFPVRGMFNEHTYSGGGGTEYIWVVSGSTIYAINITGTYGVQGLVTTSTQPAQFASSGATGGQLMILSGGTASIIDLVTTGTVAGTVSLSAQTCGYLSNRFLALDSATGTLKMSDILDGLTWSAGNFVKRSAAGDPWQAMAVAHGQIWLFGAKTGEVWYDAGLSPQPFQMVPNSLFQSGIAAIYSVAEVANSLMWLGANANGNAIVWREQGYVPQRVSTHPVELAIQGYSTISDAVAYAYQDQGHSFYVLNFPAAGHTWVYDETTGLWHERGYWNSNTMAYESLRYHTSAFAFGNYGGLGGHFVGDRITGNIYQIGPLAQADVNITTGPRRERISPVISDENKTLFHSQLVVDLQPGLQGFNVADPQAMLQWSDDSGQTWSNEHWASAGPVGQYAKRIVWRRLGRSRNRVYKLVADDAYPWRIVNAYVEAEEGTS